MSRRTVSCEYCGREIAMGAPIRAHREAHERLDPAFVAPRIPAFRADLRTERPSISGLSAAITRVLRDVVVTETGCWQVQGRHAAQGYINVAADGGRYLAHRIFFLAYVGPWVDGMTVDHICFNRGCVFPGHLQSLSNSENASRQRRTFATHCVHGHEYTPENTMLRSPKSRGRRGCRTCQNEANRRRYWARKAAA